MEKTDRIRMIQIDTDVYTLKIKLCKCFKKEENAKLNVMSNNSRA